MDDAKRSASKITNSTTKKPGPTTIEKRALDTLKTRIKEKKLRLTEIAKALTPPLSESQLRNLINGGSALSLDRFFQLTKLIQVDPFEVLHHSNPNPKFEMPFSREQEKFLVSNPWHFKIMKSLTLPRTKEEISEIFPEAPTVSAIINELLKREIIVRQETAQGVFYRVNASPFQLTSIDFVDGYTDLLLEIVKQLHETTVECEYERRDLIKFIRNMFAVDYMTPEQMMAMRDRLMGVYDEFREAVGKNKMDPSYGAIAKENLVGLVTLFAPLNRSTFLARPSGE